MSLASIVITSVVFAFLQYSEIASKDRIEEAKQQLKDLDVYRNLRAGHEDAVTRGEYDFLINYGIRRMPWLKASLYVLLVGLTLLHAADAYARAGQIESLVALSWWPVVIMVVAAGIRMSWAAAMVGKFRRDVKQFKMFLEGWRAGRNG